AGLDLAADDRVAELAPRLGPAEEPREEVADAGAPRRGRPGEQAETRRDDGERPHRRGNAFAERSGFVKETGDVSRGGSDRCTRRGASAGTSGDSPPRARMAPPGRSRSRSSPSTFRSARSRPSRA